jgi:hypothetical protein
MAIPQEQSKKCGISLQMYLSKRHLLPPTRVSLLVIRSLGLPGFAQWLPYYLSKFGVLQVALRKEEDSDE